MSIFDFQELQENESDQVLRYNFEYVFFLIALKKSVLVF